MKKIIQEILAKRLYEDLSAEEEKILNEWIGENDKNSKILDKLPKRKEIKEFIDLDNNTDVPKYYSELITKRIAKKRFRYIAITAKCAALALILLGIGFLFNMMVNHKYENIKPSALSTIINRPNDGRVKLLLDDGNKLFLSGKLDSSLIKRENIIIEEDSTVRFQPDTKKEVKINKIEVPKAAEYNFYLSDGTKVYLNSESTIEFPSDFALDKRVVKVKGEAYFDVVKDKKRPFIVKTSLIDVEVVGTQFNLKCYKDEDVLTTLVEGKVNIYYGCDKSQKVSILPKQQAQIGQKSRDIEIREVNTSIYTAWINDRFVFDDEKLADIMKVLARWYDIEVFYQNKGLEDVRLSGSFNKYSDLNNFLESIQFTDNIDVSIKNRTVIFSKK